jgi:DNA repair exonuclease SbcCD ATPase subunit
MPDGDVGDVAQPSSKHRSPWLWVSLLLGVVAIGLVVWALSLKSDRDDAQQQLTSTEQQLDKTKQDLEQEQAQPTATPTPEDGRNGALVAAGGLAAAKSVYDDLTAQLGATQEDLAATEKGLEQANADAEQAQKDADAASKKASQANNKTDKANAEADKAKADAKAAESKATVVADCTKAYFSALGALLEGDDPKAQADKVREQMKGITSECQAALAGT